MKLPFFGRNVPFMSTGAPLETIRKFTKSGSGVRNNSGGSLDTVDSTPAPATAPDELAEGVLVQIRAELPELIAVAVVDTASGRDLAAYTTVSSFAPHLAAGVNSEIIRKKQHALKLFQLDDEQIEDIIISTTSQYHIIKAINSGQKFIYLAVFAHNTGLGFAREVLRRHAMTLVA